MSASGCLELDHQTASVSARSAALLPDGTSLRLALIAAYLAEDVEPVTQNHIGNTAMIWLNAERHDKVLAATYRTLLCEHQGQKHSKAQRRLGVDRFRS